MLNHGGNLQQAKADFTQVSGDWLDLSTGISPWSWPVPAVPEHVWQRLPEPNSAFDKAVADYYGVQNLVAVAGSQVAIELLPRCLPAAVVAVPRWGYAEHVRSWSRAGHQLRFYDNLQELQTLIPAVHHCVVINPNNPTGEHYSVAALRQIQQQLQGYLIVDEAFIDAAVITAKSQQNPSPSMLPYVDDGSLVVLRSIGKFFGLAGVRLGLVGLPASLRSQFVERLSLWAISTPTVWLAQQALADCQWQQQQCLRIANQRRALLTLFEHFFSIQAAGLIELSEGPLFISIKGPKPILHTLFKHFATAGIWLRLFEPREASVTTYLRVGLPVSLVPVQQLLQQLMPQQSGAS